MKLAEAIKAVEALGVQNSSRLPVETTVALGVVLAAARAMLPDSPGDFGAAITAEKRNDNARDVLREWRGE